MGGELNNGMGSIISAGGYYHGEHYHGHSVIILDESWL